MSDLVKRLRIKAGMIEMGERIERGSDTALMREAADALDDAVPDHIADAGKVASEIHTQLAGLRGILWSPDWRTSQAREEMSDITSEIERIILAPQPAEQQPDVAQLVEALEKARDAIASLTKDALGNVPDAQQCQGWYIRDELINYISTALAAHRKGDQP